MTIVPLTWKAANAFVLAHHRHSGACRGQKFAVGVMNAGELVGVMMAGRPISRHLDDGLTLEVLRVCTDGTRNGCSMLYARAMDIGERMGYRWIITYTLASESGDSIACCRRSKDEPVLVQGEQADRPSRPRKLRATTPDRWRWTLWRKGERRAV